MAAGKMQILASIAKTETTFRAKDVVEDTGMSRQLVYHHLTSLAEMGLVEKQGAIYFVIDRNRLIDTLAESNDRGSLTRAHQTDVLMPKKSLEFLKGLSDDILAARGLELTDSLDLKIAWIHELDSMIRSLQYEKKYVTNTAFSARKASRVIGEDKEFKWAEELREKTKDLIDFTCSLSALQRETQDKCMELK